MKLIDVLNLGLLAFQRALNWKEVLGQISIIFEERIKLHHFD